MVIKNKNIRSNLYLINFLGMYILRFQEKLIFHTLVGIAVETNVCLLIRRGLIDIIASALQLLASLLLMVRFQSRSGPADVAKVRLV